MNKQQAIDKLREHGIEFVCVTERVYRFNQFEMARKDYNVPADAIVPTKDQYYDIIDIVGKDGLYAIIAEYLSHEELYLWSSSENSQLSSDSWNSYFKAGFSGRLAWYSHTKSFGSAIAFWKFVETEKQKKIKYIEKNIARLQKKLETIKNS